MIYDALVIGAGRSFQDNIEKVLQIPHKLLFVSDRCINAVRQFTDEKIITASIENIGIDDSNWIEFYDVDPTNIKVYLSCLVKKDFRNYLDERFFNIDYFHRYGKECHFKTSSRTTLKCCGNVGATMIAIAVELYNCKTIALSGLDFNFNPLPNDKFETNHSWENELNQTKDLLNNYHYDKHIQFFNYSNDSRLITKGMKFIDENI